MPRRKSAPDPFRWFDSSPEVIRLVVMLYVRYPLSLRNVEDLAHERGMDICHETVRTWVNRFGPMFASKIRRKRVQAMRQQTHWRWRLDEVYVRVQGEMKYLWRAVDHEGEVLESFVSTERDKAAALKFMKKLMKRHGCAKVITTDGLRSYRAAMKELGVAAGREVGSCAQNSHNQFHNGFRRMMTPHLGCSNVLPILSTGALYLGREADYKLSTEQYRSNNEPGVAVHVQRTVTSKQTGRWPCR